MPITPEEVVINDREREGVRGMLSLEHNMLVLSVKVGESDVILIRQNFDYNLGLIFQIDKISRKLLQQCIESICS